MYVGSLNLILVAVRYIIIRICCKLVGIVTLIAVLSGSLNLRVGVTYEL